MIRVTKLTRNQNTQSIDHLLIGISLSDFSYCFNKIVYYVVFHRLWYTNDWTFLQILIILYSDRSSHIISNIINFNRLRIKLWLNICFRWNSPVIPSSPEEVIHKVDQAQNCQKPVKKIQPIFIQIILSHPSVARRIRSDLIH